MRPPPRWKTTPSLVSIGTCSRTLRYANPAASSAMSRCIPITAPGISFSTRMRPCGHWKASRISRKYGIFSTTGVRRHSRTSPHRWDSGPSIRPCRDTSGIAFQPVDRALS